ncbi:Unknown protein, partial [Striga hermonthica]
SSNPSHSNKQRAPSPSNQIDRQGERTSVQSTKEKETSKKRPRSEVTGPHSSGAPPSPRRSQVETHSTGGPVVQPNPSLSLVSAGPQEAVSRLMGFLPFNDTHRWGVNRRSQAEYAARAVIKVYFFSSCASLHISPSYSSSPFARPQTLTSVVPLLEETLNGSGRPIPVLEGDNRRLEEENRRLKAENEDLRKTRHELTGQLKKDEQRYEEALKAKDQLLEAERSIRKKEVEAAAIAAMEKSRRALWRTQLGQGFLKAYREQLIEDYLCSTAFLKEAAAMGMDFYTYSMEEVKRQLKEMGFTGELDQDKTWEAIPSAPSNFTGDPSLPAEHPWWAESLEWSLTRDPSLKSSFDVPRPGEAPVVRLSVIVPPQPSTTPAPSSSSGPSSSVAAPSIFSVAVLSSTMSLQPSTTAALFSSTVAQSTSVASFSSSVARSTTAAAAISATVAQSTA